MTSKQPLEYLARMQELYKNPKFSDVTIRCGAKEFRAHRGLLSTHSKYFEGMLGCGMQETDSKFIALEGHEPQTIKCLLQYIYTTFYTLDSTLTVQEPEASIAVALRGHAIMHAKIYASGEYFQVPGLKERAKAQFDALMQLFPGLSFGAAAVIYTETPSTDRGLRDCLLGHTHNNADEIFHEGEHRVENERILRGVGDLGADLVLTRKSHGLKADPVNQGLAHRASKDPHLKSLMKVVAGGEASQEQLAEFQRHINAISREICQADTNPANVVESVPTEQRRISYSVAELSRRAVFRKGVRAKRLGCASCKQVAAQPGGSDEVYRCPECWGVLKSFDSDVRRGSND